MNIKEKVFKLLGRTVFKSDYARLKAEQAQIERLEAVIAEKRKQAKNEAR